MNIMVTGGAGFVGGNLSEGLINIGHNVVIIDDLSTGSLKNIPANTEFHELDLSEQLTYKKLPNNIDVVFHIASQVSSEMSYLDPVNDMKRNSFATLLLLDWAKNNSVEKFIYASSMGVYCDRLGKAAIEESKINPKSFYGVNKRCSEEFIEIFSEKGLNFTIFRLFNVYGPGQNMENLNQGMVSIYLEYILRNEPILVKGPLNRIRDYVYIEDVIDVLLLGLTTKADGKTYNVCTGEKHSVEQLIQELLKATNKPYNYPVNILPRTPRDIDDIWGNYKKLKHDFNWSHKYDLKKGISKFISSINL